MDELKSGEITRDEYFEWKINWLYTCDDCGKFEPKKQWRSAKSEGVSQSLCKPPN